MDGGDGGGDFGSDAGHAGGDHGGHHAGDGLTFIDDGAESTASGHSSASRPAPFTKAGSTSHTIDTKASGAQIPLFAQEDYAAGDAILKKATDAEAKAGGFTARVTSLIKNNKGLAFAGAAVALCAIGYAATHRKSNNNDTSPARA